MLIGMFLHCYSGGNLRGFAARTVRVCDLVVVKEVRAGEHPTKRGAHRIPMPDVGGGGGPDVGLDRDGRVREGLRRGSQLGGDLVRLSSGAAVHREAVLPGVSP